MQEGYLIDTNVIAELRRREAEPRVVPALSKGRLASST